MDYQEAIEVLKSLYPITCKMVDGRLKGGFKDYECDAGKAISVAISAINELQQYKQLGTLKEVREAVEKQTAKKPNDVGTEGYRYTDTYRCPTCGGNFSGTGIANYCYHCGQRLGWE